MIKWNSRIFAPPSPEKQRSLRAYIFKYSLFFWVEAIAGIAYNSIMVLGPILQGRLIDTAVGSTLVGQIIKAALLFLLVTALFQILRYFKRYYLRYLATLMSADMRVGLVDAILHKEMGQLQQQKVGDMMSRTVGDIDEVVEATRKTITEVWDTWVLMIAYFVALIIKDYQITLIAAIPIPLAILLAESMKTRVYTASMEARNTSSKVSSHIRTLIMNTGLLRLFGLEETQLKKLDVQLNIQAEKNAKAAILKNGMGAIYSMIASLGIIIVVAYGGSNAASGQWTIGDFIAYITIYSAMALRTTTAAKVFNIQQGAKASWTRICEVLGNKEDDKSKDSNLNIIDNSKEFKLVVDKLSFKYPTSQAYSISNISFSAEPGTIVGITGAVGSGKTSLAMALTGMYQYEGSIKINDIELSTLTKSVRTECISYMGHHSALFSKTLKENVTWGDFDAEEFEKAIELAALDNDLHSFDKGMETMIGVNGHKVSGGQQQRIALARACYAKSGLLILDDPFSAIDIGTEARILERLHEVNPKGIIIVLSHRLAVFEQANQILVLDKGKILQRGTHQALCQIEGVYREIVLAQQFMERSKSNE